MKVIKIILILMLFFNLIIPASAALYIVYNQSGECIALTNIEPEISKYKALGYHVEGVYGDKNKNNQGNVDLKLIDLAPQEPKDGKVEILGIIENTSKSNITDIKVRITCVDNFGKLITYATNYSDPKNIQPGQQAFFTVIVSQNERIEDYKFSVFYNKD
jgi:hypothetical protein